MPPQYDVVTHSSEIAHRRSLQLSLISPWREGLQLALRAAYRALKLKLRP